MIPVDKISDFNEAKAKMYRLAGIQEKANMFSSIDDYYNWFKQLMNIYKEIYGKLTVTKGTKKKEYKDKVDERQDGKDMINKIKKRLGLDKNRKTQPKGVGSFHKGKEGEKTTEELLFDFDCWLREMIDNHGFGAPTREDQRWALGN